MEDVTPSIPTLALVSGLAQGLGTLPRLPFLGEAGGPVPILAPTSCLSPSPALLPLKPAVGLSRQLWSPWDGEGRKPL